jgi:DNA-binding cell septation regulator SpoVG
LARLARKIGEDLTQFAPARNNTAPQPQSVTAVTVEKLQLGNGGVFKAFADVSIANKVMIHDVRIIQQQGQEVWVNMPQREIPFRGGGKSSYLPIVTINGEKLKAQIESAVLAAREAQR